jgi:hypothetical protein
LHDETIVPYDTLILTMGLQDKTLSSLGYISRGIAPLPKDKKRIEGLISIDDPYLYQHLRKSGTLMNALTNRKRPGNCVVYGRTLHTYCCIEGLIKRGVRAENIHLVVPESFSHVRECYDDDQELKNDIPIINPEAFEDENLEGKIHAVLEAKGVKIIKNAEIMEISEDDENNLESVLFKLLDIPDEEEDEDELEDLDEKSQKKSSINGSQMDGSMDGEDEEGTRIPKKKRKKNELDIECKVLISAGHRDVDADVFNAIHNNGLVYNGRLIVDKNFQTTDPSIFAAGSLCEFSGRYKALSQGRSLRLDRYNGREMGSRLARSVFDIYDPSIGTGAGNPDQSSMSDEELPNFYLPQGSGGIIPGDLIYYYIKTTNPLMPKPGYVEKKNRKDLVCDNLDVNIKGHLIKFTFNSIGLIDSVTYMGSEEIVLQSLWSFVGLHENYLNSLTSR